MEAATAIPRMAYGASLLERDSVLCLRILMTALWRVPPLDGVLLVVSFAPQAIVIVRPVGQAFQN